MADLTELAAELRDINENLVNISNSIKNSTETIYKGIISSAKIQAAQNDFDRNTAINEADEYLKQITQE